MFITHNQLRTYKDHIWHLGKDGSNNNNDNSGGVIGDSDTWQWLTISLAMLGKFSISSSNVIMPVFTAELFPTVIRNLGVGSSNVPAGIALMIVPYLWNMVRWSIVLWPWMLHVYLVFSIISKLVLFIHTVLYRLLLTIICQ